MGETVVRIRLRSTSASTEIDALVDTGATFSKIPGPVAATLGLQIERQVSILLGDGRVIQRGLATVEVEVAGERGRVPVAIGGAEERPLLGYTTLEILGFKVNPFTRSLEKTRAIEHLATEGGMHIKLAPSILSADFARLGEQVAEAEQAGADYIHVDVMDGHFVPNITFGPLVVGALRPRTKLPLDVHLMIEEPERFIPWFAKAGADILTVHAEAPRHLHRVIQQVREAGVKAGVALNPATPIAAVEEVLPDVDLVLVMTVNPGFPAQAFIESVLDKVGRMRRLLDTRGLKAELEVDGGISEATAPGVLQAGATVLVAGSAIFNQRERVSEAVERIRRSIRAASRDAIRRS